MSKTTRTLSGAAKNSFLKGVVKSALGEDHQARERLMAELTAAIASLRVRVEAERGRKTKAAGQRAQPQPATARTPEQSPVEAAPAEPFDPYSPNVIVVIRTRGRDAALAALASITTEQNLRLLAREQQLGLPKDPMSLPEIRDAIVAAGERRIANRLAAGR